MTKHLLVSAMTGFFAVAGISHAGPSPDPVQAASRASSATLSPAQREAIVAQIVGHWGSYVTQVHGTSSGAWATRMRGTFAAANDANLQRAAGMQTFQGMMDALLGQHLSDRQVLDSLATQAVVLNSGSKPALLGSTTADLVYTPLAPCRLADTRVVGGPIAGGFSRGFHGYTASNFAAQGGNASSNCGIPANPSGLMLNITVVSPTGTGYLTVFPFGTTQPFAANLNFGAGATVGNEIAAKMTIGSATDEFSVFASNTTNVVVDAVGYFMAPQATPPDTTTVNGAPTNIPAGTDTAAFVPACPTGYAQTATYCSSAAGKPGIYVIGVGVGGCTWRNLSGVDVSLYSYVQCARIPGR